MALLSSLYVLFIFALSAFSAPVPNPQATVSATVSAAVAPQTLEVVTPGELTTPSQGGTFDDFLELPSTGKDTAAAPVARRFEAARLVNRGPIPGEFRRFFTHGGFNFNGDGGCDSGVDCFEAVAPPPKKGKPPKKGAASPPNQGAASPSNQGAALPPDLAPASPGQ